MGFAAEIKEFLGAAKDSWKLMSDTESKDADIKYKNVLTAEKQKEMDDPLNQKLKEAKLAHALATTANIGKEHKLSPLDQLIYDRLKNPPPDPTLGAVPGAGTSVSSRPAPGSGSPTTPSETYDPSYGALPAPRLYRKGGLVRKFAEGGIIEDDDLDEPYVPAPAIGPTDTSAQSYTNKPGMLTPTAQPQRRAVGPAVGGVPMPREKPRELQAVADGLKYGVSQLPAANLAAIGSGGSARGRSAALRALAMGAGAAPGSDMLSIYKKIDPDGTMPEGERNLQALQAVHNYKMSAGDPEGAAKTAFQMLQHFKTAQSRYGALAAAAMQGGHVEEGVKLALKQYANIPDGNNLQMWVDKKSGRIGWKLDDPNGKPITGGVATPEEIGSNAAKLAAPGGYENYLTQMVSGAKIGGRGVGAGGKKEEEEEPDVLGAKPPKAAEYGEIKQEQIDKYVNSWNDAQQLDANGKKKEGAKSLEPKELAATKNMLYHIRRHNDVTDDQGLQRIQTLLNAPDPVEGETPALQVRENKENKSRTFVFNDGGEITIPNTQLGMFRAARAEAQAQRKKEAADLLEAAKPGKTMQALDKADEYFHNIGTDPKTGKNVVQNVGEAISDVAGAVPEAVSNSTLGTIGRGVGTIGRGVGTAVDEANKWLGTASKTIGEEGGAGAIAKGTGAAAREAQRYLRDNPEATP